MHLRRMLFNGEPEVGGEELVAKHEFGNAELQVGIIPGHGGRLVLGLPVSPRDHDRPGCGGRGFSGSRRGHGRPSRKGDGRGYQGPGCGRGGGTERLRRGGNGRDRGGAQSQRLWDGGGDHSRKIGRSRGLPSSGGDISREMGRSQGLLCSGSDKGRGIGRSRRLGREPGAEGCMAALGHRDGSSGGAFLSRQRGDACLLLPEGPRRVLKPGAGSGGVSVQNGELCTEGSYQPFMLGGSQFDRVSIGGGPRGVVSRYPGAGESFLHIVEGDPLHGGLLRRFEAIPYGLQVSQVGRGSVGDGRKVRRQWGSGTHSRGAASPQASVATDVRRWHGRQVQGRTGSRRRLQSRPSARLGGSGGSGRGRHAMGGSQRGQGRKIARGAHTVGEGRVVSHKRRYSRGGFRNTVIVYRSMPLRGER